MYATKNTITTIVYLLPMSSPRSCFIPATNARPRLVLSISDIEYMIPRIGRRRRSTRRLVQALELTWWPCYNVQRTHMTLFWCASSMPYTGDSLPGLRCANSCSSRWINSKSSFFIDSSSWGLAEIDAIVVTYGFLGTSTNRKNRKVMWIRSTTQAVL